jgi:DNA-binding transcriptional LysR family regulator
MALRFDLVDLQLFLHVVEAGSITGGAAALQLAPTAASARVLAMENTLGLPLLTREARGVQPTAAGQVLALHARTLLQQMAHLQGSLAEHGPGMKTQIRLLCNTEAMHEVIPDRLADYLLAHPQVNLLVQERPGYEVVSALTEGMADVGIVREHTDVYELESFVFNPDRLVLVVPRGHALQALAQQRPVPLEAADSCDIVGLPQGTALQDIWDSRAAQRGRRLNYRIRVNSFDEQCRLVADGAGIALMPQSSARRNARTTDVAVLPLADAYTAFALRLCVRRLADLPAVTQRLVSSLLAADVRPATVGPP